jgi:transcription-repair coupling factor (superfamily II helicase)
MEAGFCYTSDKDRAINSILSHLKSGKVMDMLLSGDVGFGKTEVAMNAIFACVKSGFQALFFVPTTLLCAQHYKSLQERLSKFDIDVRRLDRFSSTKDKSRLQADLRDGKPLVAIGTHALLSIQSANLGLIIIDEEHKFGVKQKEKLKEFSEHSHLLSMSATPIPRSLNMALSSIKSYSTLTTPPLDRLDVRTFVKEWDRGLIKEAIMREIRRAGQIFYLHNKIADMPSIERELKQIVPTLKILTLHSKIDAKTSEDEMIKFANGEYDLLLCTSIVESGIHIPNANTIIIDEANKFGIADLHQLR